MDRRSFTRALAGSLVVAPFASHGQQQDKVRRIGFLAARSRSTPSNPEVYYDAFVDGMQELGYVEGKNLVIEWRFAEGKYERLPGLAAELVRLKPEVIVSHATPPVEALRQATSTIPIVCIAVGDPVGSGLVASLARPGGNITGTSLMNIDVSAKQLELLKLIVPELSRVAVLVNPATTVHTANLKSFQSAAQQIGVKILPVAARTAEEIERGFASMRQERADGVVILGDAFFIGQRRQITELGMRNRLPSLFFFREDVVVGGLVSYGQNLANYFRRAATYVDKIFKGAKPGDLPVEQPTTLELVVNLKTAKALGLTVPQSFLIRADEVIQ